MRKSMTRVLLLALILALLCVGAMAADTLTIGQTETQKANYTVTPLDAKGVEVKPNAEGKYENVEKFSLTYSDASGEQLVMLLKDGTAPTASNIYYIDQKTGSGSFDIYPKQMTSGKYYLMVASQKSDDVATIEYTADYILGDVNRNGDISVTDASWIKQYLVSMRTFDAEQLKIGDVNKVDGITVTDASWILQRLVNIRDENYNKVKK